MKSRNVTAYHAIKEARRKLNHALMTLNAQGGDAKAQRELALTEARDASRDLEDAVRDLSRDD